MYASDPVGGPEGQPEFLNAVVEVDTGLDPRGLLSACLEVEEEVGRVRAERWEPRVVDLDILSYEDRVIAEPDLEVPHPRMHERGFVLVPLLELDADPHLPGGRKVASLRLGPQAIGGVRLHAPPLV